MGQESTEIWTVQALLQPGQFLRSRLLANQHATGLRAGDALHLGIAAHNNEAIIALDKTLIKAALAAGISANLP